MTKKVRERDFFLALMKKREAEKKSGVTSVYLPEQIDTGFLSRDHSGTVSIWSDKQNQTLAFSPPYSSKSGKLVGVLRKAA